MALFDARLASVTVTMNDNAHVDHLTQVTNTPASYTWTTTSGFDITVTSLAANIVAAPAAAPTAGTINRIVARDAADDPLYTVSGLNAALAPMVLSRPAYWQAILAGNSQILAPTSRDFQGFGDIFTLLTGAFDAGNDLYAGGSNATLVDQDFQGDAFEMDGGTLNGGNDTIGASGAGELIGDVKFLSGGLARGGRDSISLIGSVDDGANGTETAISGDVDSMAAGARLIAGDDSIVIGNVVAMQKIAGDAFTVGAGVEFAGGDDTITATGAATGGDLFGDVTGQIGAGAGGDDVMLLSMQFERIGGDFRVVTGIAQGGSDTITLSTGGAGSRVSGDADQVLATGRLRGGNDLIDAGLYAVSVSASGDVIAADGRLVGGNDTMTGGASGDTLSGDADVLGGAVLTGGNDVISGGPGDDLIAGEVRLVVGGGTVQAAGNDRLDGGDGNDTLLGQAGNDTLIGGAGDDTMDGGGIAGTPVGLNWVFFDTLPFSVTVDLQAGNATGQGNDTILNVRNARGSQADDAIGGTAAPNTLIGLGGDDALYGQDGNDTLNGGDGRDSLYGGAGDDSMFGGTGNDSFWVNTAGDATVETAAGSSGGTDTVFSTVNHTLAANVEILRLEGSGDRTGTGNGLANRLFGNTGNNLLAGLAGNDSIEGGAGADTLAGGAGNDTLTGGGGFDVFRFAAAAAGADRITDFAQASDRFQLSGGTFTALLEAGVDTILTHGGGTIRVLGVTGLTLGQWNALVIPGGEAGGGASPMALWAAAHHAATDWLYA